MKPALLVALALTLGASSGAHPRPTAALAGSPCNFGRGKPLPDQSTWADQFRCYQTSGRRVSVPGSAFDAGTVSGGVCILSVTADRLQIAACGSFAGDAAMILPYSTIAYVVDDPRTEHVALYVSALFRR